MSTDNWLDYEPHAATKLVRRHFKHWRRRVVLRNERRATRLRVVEWTARRIERVAFMSWRRCVTIARYELELRDALERWFAWTIERQGWIAAKAQAKDFRRYHLMLWCFKRWTKFVEVSARIKAMVSSLRS